MRKGFSLMIAGLAVLAFTACSSGSSKTASPTPTGSNTSSSSSSGGNGGGTKSTPEIGKFCRDLISASSAISDASDLSGASEALAVFQSVDPPAELADVWDDYLSALDQLSRIDPNDSNALGQLGINHATSLGKVSLFISQSCAGAALSSDFSS